MKDFIRYIRILVIRAIAGLRAKPLKVNGKVLIIAPHPDDEIIGCAGFMQSCLKNHTDIHICILTGGEASHKQCCHISEKALSDKRRSLATTINQELGILQENIIFLNFPDGQINENHTEYQKLIETIVNIQPDAIFIPHQKGEGWPDHINANKLIQLITKDAPIHLYEYCVWFWYYNVWSIDWENAFLIRMTDNEHKKKLQAIQDYITPLAPCGKPYSGVLPKVFINGNQWKNELYFRIK